MLTKDKLTEINETLVKNFGYLYDKPKYRLSWTTDAFEARYVEGI